MKVVDLVKESYNNGKGDYIAFAASESTKNKIEEWLKNNNLEVDNKTINNAHMTIIYSSGKSLPDNIGRGNIDPIIIKADDIKLDLFDNAGNAHYKSLVLIYDCDQASMRHKDIRKEYGATHDYPNFLPHLTVSYKTEKDLDLKKLKPIDFDLIFDYEYQEAINYAF